MIVCEGPDNVGKTTLAKVLRIQSNRSYYHFDQTHRYSDYIYPMSKLYFYKAVLDRCFLSEVPYSKTMRRVNCFSQTDWRNLVHLLIAQAPVIVFMTGKSSNYIDSYLPLESWESCLLNYEDLWKEIGLSPWRVNFMEEDPLDLANKLLELEEKAFQQNSWWKEYWAAGYAPGGQLQNPELYILADRLGPSNLHNLVFEAGPTAELMNQLIDFIGIPLGRLCIDNIVKDHRGSSRKVSKQDLTALEKVLVEVKPKKAVLMGAVAKEGARILANLGIPYIETYHLGWLNRRGNPSGERVSLFSQIAEFYKEGELKKEEEWKVKLVQ